MATATTLSTDQEAELRKHDRLKVRRDKAVAALDELETERVERYLAARALGVTYRVIAARWGITEAAVMQSLRRQGVSTD